MIEFYGEISGNCKHYMLKREAKFGIIGSSITAVLFGIPIIIASITIHWIFLICIPALIMIVFLAGVLPSKKIYSLIFPSKVLIDPDQNMLMCESEKFHYECLISDVVKVLDYGEWYHIYVKDRVGRYVCQKSLIQIGTLQEFETLFHDKIIKK